MLTNAIKKSIDLFFQIWPRTKPKKEELQALKIVAHRGVHESSIAKENTIKSFEIALDYKLWGIEFDIQWTSDLVPIILHDNNTQRVFKKDIQVNQVSMNELRELCPEIPTLTETLELFAKKIHLLIEIKEPLSKEKLQRLKQELSPLEEIKDYHLLALEPEIFTSLSGFNKESFLLVAFFRLPSFSQLCLQNKWGGLAGHYLLFDKKKRQLHLEQQQTVGIGFINSKNALFREAKLKNSWLFTDKATSLAKALNKI